MIVESPTYPGVLAAARLAGLVPVPVPLDEQGLRPELVAAALASSRARLIVCQPIFQNPTGATMTTERCHQVLELARAAGSFVVEDDFARHLVHADCASMPIPMVSDDPDGAVVHIRSMTKSTSANLRVAAVVARGPAYERLRASLVINSLFVARPLQEATVELVTSSAWPRHLRSLGADLLRRRQTLSMAVQSLESVELTLIPRGGYQLWLRLIGLDPAAVGQAGLAHGVAVAPGGGYFANEPDDRYLRVSHAAAVDTVQLAEGISRLRSAIQGLR